MPEAEDVDALFTDDLWLRSATHANRMAALLVRDLLNATNAGITGTPAFIVNNDPLFAGYKTYEEWKEILDAAIRKAATAPTK